MRHSKSARGNTTANGTEKAADSAAITPSVLNLPQVKLVTSARIAIALALQKMKVGAGDQVLIPDYHCLSMVEPVHWSGGTPLYYSLRDDFSIDFDQLATQDLSGVKAILVTHFFGFPQPMRAITSFCAARNIGVIEDCAHALFGSADGQPIGSWGDYAAASLMKFYPVYDGGCLASAHHDLSDIPLLHASGRFQFKSLFNSVERGLRYQRFPGIQVFSKLTLSLKDGLWSGYKKLRFRHQTQPRFEDPAASEGSSGLDARWLNRRISLVSQCLLLGLPVERIVERRRHNYRRLALELRNLPHTRLPFPDLPEHVVPYVLPLLVEHPERVFERLKRIGMPLFRWDALSDELDPNLHAQALRYSTSLFQIPCHQELTDADLTWMIRTLHTELKALS
jgi:dTDP-4-amino-4,6-dideoxygalactose transaminase